MDALIKSRALVLVFAFGVAIACGPSVAQEWDPTPRDDGDAGDKNRLPIVFVHGQNGAGDQFERQAMHFTSNGYPASWIVPFDYSTGRAGSQPARPRSTDSDGAARPPRRRERPTGPYTRDTTEALDKFIDAGGKVGWMPAYQDHVMVCTSDESFWSIYTFFNDGEKPKTMRMEPEERPQIGGYVKSYIFNKPLAGARVEVWEVAQATGMRINDKPLITLTAAEDGRWGPFSARPGQHYEFVVRDTAASTPRHYFHTPFTHSNHFVYFRITAAADDYAQSPFERASELMTGKHAAFVVRHQNGSLVPGVMTLKLNGTDLVVAPILPTTKGPRQNPTVALYIVDGNENGRSDLERIKSFAGPFVASADVFVPADPKSHVEFKLNDHVLNVPALPASEAGPISVVFENWD